MLHGSVQSKLTACALAIDRASLTNDATSYSTAIDEARNVLRNPWNFVPREPAQTTLETEVAGKVELWNGLADINLFISPEIRHVTGEAVHPVSEIVEEALSNAIRHGSADTITVRIDRAHKGSVTFIKVSVVDDGVGLTGGKAGLGTALLDEICAGRWNRTSMPEGGCALNASIRIETPQRELARG